MSSSFARIVGACSLFSWFAASAFAADAPQQGSATAPTAPGVQPVTESAAPEADAPKQFRYGPIQAKDPEARAQIKKLYRDQADLDRVANERIDSLVKSIEGVYDSDLQLQVAKEVMETKKQLTINSMEIGLQIAKLNEDEERVAQYEKALDQMLHPEKYTPATLDPSIAEERARQMGLK
ncbi:MAG TPA: hypothetical protein VFR10_15030 [bacterium]|nr:hypothetical protein [bacterium]